MQKFQVKFHKDAYFFSFSLVTSLSSIRNAVPKLPDPIRLMMEYRFPISVALLLALAIKSSGNWFGRGIIKKRNGTTYILP